MAQNFLSDIKLGDDIYIRLGDATNGDLQIYHDGDHSYIQDAGTGELRLAANVFRVLNANTSETMIYAAQDGKVQLRFNESTKFETNTNGVKIVDNLGIGVNPSDVYGIYQDFNATDPNIDNKFAYFIDADFSGADNTDGDREQGGIRIDIDSTADGDANDEHRLYGVWSDVRYSGFTDIARAGYFFAENNNSTGSEQTLETVGVYASAVGDGTNANAGTNNLKGVQGQASVQNAGYVAAAYGGFFQSYLAGVRTADANNLVGVRGEVEIDSSSSITLTNARAMQAIIDIDNTTPTITNSYLLYGGYEGDTSSITNKYGIYLLGSDNINRLDGVTMFQPGTAAAPSITRVAETDTGIYFPATDTIGFTTGGTERVRITSGGGVGIGTDNPTGKFNSYISATRQLTHNGNGGDLSIISDNNSSPVFYVKGTGTADLVNVFDNTSEVFTILDGGNVGIRVTSPAKDLVINNATGARLQLQFNGNDRFRMEADSFGGSFYSPAGYGARFFTSGSERMRITSGGAVLVGSTSALDTATRFQVTGTSSGVSSYWSNADKIIFEHNTNLGMTFATPNDHAGSIAFADPESTNAGYIQYHHDGDYMRFGTGGGAERMRIASDGTITLNAYGAGYLKTDANGVISVDTDTIEDTLQSVTDRGASTTNRITFSNGIDVTGGSTGADIYINNSSPTLGFTDSNSYTDANDIYIVRGGGTDRLVFNWYDDSANTTTETFHINSSGDGVFAGKLGVGSSTISHQLQVHNASGNGSQMNFTDNTTTAADGSGLRVGYNGTYGQVYLFENAALRFATNNTERAKFTNAGHFIPGADSTYDLGTNTVRWRNVYADNLYGIVDKLSVTANDTFTGTYSLLWHSGNVVYSSSFMTINGATDTLSVPNISTTGDVSVGGDLNVTGSINQSNITNLQVDDKTITLNFGSGDTSSTANGSGIIIQDAVDASTDATILWDKTNAQFDFNQKVHVTANGSILLLLENSATSGADSKIRIRGARNAQTYSDGSLLSSLIFSNHDSDDSTVNHDLGEIGVGMYDGSGNTGYLRLKVNNGSGLQTALDIDKNKDAKFLGKVGIGSLNTSYNLYNNGTSYFNDEVTIDSTVRLTDATAGLIYSPQESGVSQQRYFIMFDNTNDASYPFLTNRTPNGAVVIKTGTAAAGGENEHFRIKGGDGTVDAYFTNVNLGIGQDTPVNDLDIYKATGDASIRMESAAASDSSILKFRNNNSDAHISVDQTTSNRARMQFIVDTDDGFVNVVSLEPNRDTIIYDKAGVGTTSPQYKLDVDNGSNAGDGIIIPFRIGGGNMTSANDGTSLLLTNRHSAVTGGDYGAYMRIVNTQSNPSYLNPRLEFGVQNNNTNAISDIGTKMTILGTGNVGIGTDSPQAALHVAGAFNSTSPTGNGVLMGYYLNAYGYIQLNGTSGGYIDFSTSGTDHKGRILYDNTNNYLRFDTDGAERMRITSGGKVGIDVENPDAELQVGPNQNSNATGISFAAGSSVGNLIARTTTHHNWFPYSDGNNYYSAGTHTFRNGSHSTNYLTLTSSLATFTGAITLAGTLTNNVAQASASVGNTVTLTKINSNNAYTEYTGFLNWTYSGTGSNPYTFNLVFDAGTLDVAYEVVLRTGRNSNWRNFGAMKDFGYIYNESDGDFKHNAEGDVTIASGLDTYRFSLDSDPVGFGAIADNNTSDTASSGVYSKFIRRYSFNFENNTTGSDAQWEIYVKVYNFAGDIKFLKA